MGGAYEVTVDLTSGTVTGTKKYYSIAGQMVAMNDGTGLKYFLQDHLGSVVAVVDASGALLSQQRYLPFGGTRTLPGAPLITQTDFGYTGQRDLDATGLMDYKARFYDPYLNHFTQPDSIIPDPGNSQDWDRYAYVRNNPLRYTDPTGHESFCEQVPQKGGSRNLCEKTALKKQIKENFGITMSDKGNDNTKTYKEWDVSNLALAYRRLQNINTNSGGNLKNMIGGATFMLAAYVMTKEKCPGSIICSYGGWTSGTNITFDTTGNQLINGMNFYHEFGHMLNSLSGHDNIFSDRLKKLDNPSFIVGNDTSGFVNEAALLGAAEPIQASSGDIKEQWGDVFANYMAGNIDLSKSNVPGNDMYKFITDALKKGLGN